MGMQRIYLQEEPHVEAGMEDAYAAAVKNVIYPMLQKPGAVTRIRPIGAFCNDVAYDSQWSSFTFLWAFAGWEDYAKERSDAASAKRDDNIEYHLDPDMAEYVRTAGNLRRRSIERLLAPVSFSPIPEPLPIRTSSNSAVIRQLFKVEKKGAPGFLEQMQTAVLPAANRQKLKLELLARVVGSPREYTAYWTLPGWQAWGEFQKCRDVHSMDNFLPGSERLWDHVAEITEMTLMPFPYSPLGGIA